MRYKVLFNNNVAVSAAKLYAPEEEVISIGEKDRQKFIEWIIVNAYDEADAMGAATRILNEYRDAFLS